jgi:hypothetical protein
VVRPAQRRQILGNVVFGVVVDVMHYPTIHDATDDAAIVCVENQLSQPLELDRVRIPMTKVAVVPSRHPS